jgi:acyl-CoA synthetase (AMP-forming)/AMP-acid ligase II
VFQNENLTNEIALFVEDEHINEEFLKNELKNNLPNYMIPTRIIKEKEFPLNSNGKIDRKSLSLKLIENK